MFDLLCLLILLGVSVCLRTVRPGWLYYWLKDITNEFLKMSVLSTAFEIADKVGCCCVSSALRVSLSAGTPGFHHKQQPQGFCAGMG